MNQKAYLRARQEFDLAKAKLEGMRTASHIAAYAQLWSDYLTHLQRAFTKMRIATASGPSKGWYDQIENQRSTDALLSYLRHARNADEHGVDPVTTQKPGGIGLKPKIGNSLYIDRLEIKNGKLTLGPKAAKNAKIEFIPASVHLSAVRDRGIDYQPPTSHLNAPLQDTTPIGVAEAALKFFENLLTQANRFSVG